MASNIVHRSFRSRRRRAGGNGLGRRLIHSIARAGGILLLTAPLLVLPPATQAQSVWDICVLDPLTSYTSNSIAIGACPPSGPGDCISDQLYIRSMPGVYPVIRLENEALQSQVACSAVGQIGIAAAGYTLSTLADDNDLVIQTMSDLCSGLPSCSGDVIISANCPGAQIRFATQDPGGGDTEKMRIANNGYVSVGKAPAAPQAHMHIQLQSTQATSAAWMKSGLLVTDEQSLAYMGLQTDPTGPTQQYDAIIAWGDNMIQQDEIDKLNFVHTPDFGLTTRNVMTLTSEGMVGIGVTTPTERLTVDGNIAPSINNQYDLGVSTGNWWNCAYITNGVCQLSDIRFKENVEDIAYGLNEILQLRPISYSWLGRPDGPRKLGLVAQELQTLIGEVVSETTDQEARLGVLYSDLIPVLVKAIQEQQELIEYQAVELTSEADRQSAMQAELSSLRQELDVIRQHIGKALPPRTGADIAARLYPNSPNPFAEATRIGFFLPAEIAQAEIIVYEAETGLEVLRRTISARGASSLRIDAADLASGVYLYELFADGRLLGGDKMIIAR